MSYAAPKDGLPVFLCEPCGIRQVRFWCPFCCRYHFHGMVNSTGRPEHRIAHCPGLKNIGYYITLKRPRQRAEVVTYSPSQTAERS